VTTHALNGTVVRVGSDMAPPQRTLIVDGYLLFAEALGAALAGEGYEIVGAFGSEVEAVEAAGRIRPDLILVGLNLSDGRGIDAGAAILERSPSATIVAMGEVASFPLAQDAIRAGFHGYVTKDSGIAPLVDALRVVAGGTGPADVPGRWSGGGGDRRRPEPRPWGSLTSREREILVLLAQGIATRDIAVLLHIAPHTVRSHVQSLMFKLGVHSRLEAVASARRRGLIPAVASIRPRSGGEAAKSQGSKSS
jgi:two-component system, NarL family, nitrate/nitrite response regulator NarL